MFKLYIDKDMPRETVCKILLTTSPKKNLRFFTNKRKIVYDKEKTIH